MFCGQFECVRWRKRKEFMDAMNVMTLFFEKKEQLRKEEDMFTLGDFANKERCTCFELLKKSSFLVFGFVKCQFLIKVRLSLSGEVTKKRKMMNA